MQNPFGESPFPQPSDHPPQEGLRSRGYLRAAAALAATVLALTGCSKPPVGAEQLPSPTPSITAAETPGTTPTPEITRDISPITESAPENVKSAFNKSSAVDIVDVKTTADENIKMFELMYTTHERTDLTPAEQTKRRAELQADVQRTKEKLQFAKLPANFDTLVNNAANPNAKIEGYSTNFDAYKDATTKFFADNFGISVYFDANMASVQKAEMLSFAQPYLSPVKADNPYSRKALTQLIMAYGERDVRSVQRGGELVFGKIAQDSEAGTIEAISENAVVSKEVAANGETTIIKEVKTITTYDISHPLQQDPKDIVNHEEFQNSGLREYGANVLKIPQQYTDPAYTALKPFNFEYSTTNRYSLLRTGKTSDGKYTTLDSVLEGKGGQAQIIEYNPESIEQMWDGQAWISAALISGELGRKMSKLPDTTQADSLKMSSILIIQRMSKTNPALVGAILAQWELDRFNAQYA